MRMEDRKVQKTVYLPLDVAEELEEESNQSKVVERGIREVLDV